MGPRLNLPLPSRQSVAVGRVNVGPMPQMIAPGFAGDRNSDGLMSPSPQALPEMLFGPVNSEGWLMTGTMVRVIRFHSWFSLMGITG